MILTFDQIRAYFEARHPGQRIGTREKASVKCIFHDDRTPSCTLFLDGAGGYPGAQLLLIEPVIEFRDDIHKILAQRPGIYLGIALGSAPGERELRIEPQRPLLTSFYNRHPLERTGDDPALRRVPVDTLDHAVSNAGCPPPFGLKIDAEGSELEVIRGATDVLNQTDFIIAEVSVLPRFLGSYHFAEFIAELDVRGFELCDILDIGRGDSSHVTFFDLVFHRKEAK